eukprot:scaffold12486_cov112-Isochrysis_galbana.AAC.4
MHWAGAGRPPHRTPRSSLMHWAGAGLFKSYNFLSLTKPESPTPTGTTKTKTKTQDQDQDTRRSCHPCHAVEAALYVLFRLTIAGNLTAREASIPLSQMVVMPLCGAPPSTYCTTPLSSSSDARWRKGCWSRSAADGRSSGSLMSAEATNAWKTADALVSSASWAGGPCTMCIIVS